MKKSDYSFMYLSALLITMPAFAQNRAIEISISGIGPAVDAPAYETVRQVIGHAVANGVLDKFVVYGYGVEGGFSSCVEMSPNSQLENLNGVVQQLNSIRPNPLTTAYSVKSAEYCNLDQVVCTLDAKQCPDGSYVSRVPPSCAFDACPGVR